MQRCSHTTERTVDHAWDVWSEFTSARQIPAYLDAADLSPETVIQVCHLFEATYLHSGKSKVATATTMWAVDKMHMRVGLTEPFNTSKAASKSAVPVSLPSALPSTQVWTQAVGPTGWTKVVDATGAEDLPRRLTAQELEAGVGGERQWQLGSRCTKQRKTILGAQSKEN